MGILADIWPYVAALLPSIGLLYLFYVIMKHIVEGDRRERAAQRKWDLEHGIVSHDRRPENSADAPHVSERENPPSAP